MEPNYSLAPQAEDGGVPHPGLLLKNVYGLYSSRWGRWFCITAPTSLLAAAVLFIADQRIKAIFRGIPRSELENHWGEIAGVTLLRFGAFFLSWLLGCFALAAIATVVSGLDDDAGDTAWRNDSHQRAREHFGSLVLAALLTFCAFMAGIAVAGFVEFTAIRMVGWARFSRFNNVATLAGIVVVASVVSWLGTAIPLVVRGSTGVWAALKKSVELSNGYEGALFLLVVQSVAGSYVAWYMVYYGLRILAPGSFFFTVWGYWTVNVLAILAGATAEPPIFIGLSLLADPERLAASSQDSQHMA